MKELGKILLGMAGVLSLAVPNAYGQNEYVFYLAAGEMVELYNNGHWWSNDLTIATNTPPANMLTSMFDGSAEHVYYDSGSNHVSELYYSNGRWWGNDLTADTNGPGAWSAISALFVP